MLTKKRANRIRRRIAFTAIDPLGAGISEEIHRMQNDPNSAIDLFDRPTGEELQDYLKNLMAIDMGDTAQMSFEIQEG